MLPEVIIHNSVTLDNAFTADAFSKKSVDIGLHYEILMSFEPDALLIGSGSSTGGIELCGGNIPHEEKSDLEKPATDAGDKRPYGIFIDSRGQLMNKLHFYRRLPHIKDALVLVSKKTPEEYIKYLTERNYDFVVSGDVKPDYMEALLELNRRYGFKRIVSDSGSILNGVILGKKIACILSLLVYPEIAGKDCRKLFENVSVPIIMELEESRQIRDGIIHNMYKLNY